jgi:hypothetical protein
MERCCRTKAASSVIRCLVDCVDFGRHPDGRHQTLGGDFLRLDTGASGRPDRVLLAALPEPLGVSAIR